MQMGYRSNKSIDPRSAGGKWILLIFLAAGLILLAIAGFLAVRHARKLESYARTTAVIVGFDEQRDGDEKTHRTIVEYMVEGSPRQATVGVYSSSFFVGDELSAAYDPKNPGDLILTGVWGWLGSAICGFIGLVFTLIGGICLYLFQIRPWLQERKGINLNDKPAPWER